MTNNNVKQQEQIWTRFSEVQKSVLTGLLENIPMTVEEKTFNESLKMNNAEYKIIGEV